MIRRAAAPHASASTRLRRRTAACADEQVLAANVDVALVVAGLDGDFNLRRLERYLAVAWTGGATPVDRAQQGRRGRRRSTGCASPPRPSRPASRSGRSPRSPATASRRLADDHLPPGRTAVVLGSLGRRQVHARQRARSASERQRTGAVRDDDSRGRHTTTHRELVRLPGGALLIDTPGIRVARRRRRRRRARRRVRRHRRRSPRAAGSATAATRASPAAASGPRSPTARLAPDRLASHRKLEREAAHVARANRSRSSGRGAPQVEGDPRRRSASTCSASTGATDDDDRSASCPAADEPAAGSRSAGAGPRRRARAWPPPTTRLRDPRRHPRADRRRGHAPPLHPPRQLGPARGLRRRHEARRDRRATAASSGTTSSTATGSTTTRVLVEPSRMGARGRPGPRRLVRAPQPRGRVREPDRPADLDRPSSRSTATRSSSMRIRDAGYVAVRWDAEMLRPSLDADPERPARGRLRDPHAHRGRAAAPCSR